MGEGDVAFYQEEGRGAHASRLPIKSQSNKLIVAPTTGAMLQFPVWREMPPVR